MGSSIDFDFITNYIWEGCLSGWGCLDLDVNIPNNTNIKTSYNPLYTP